MTNYYTFSSEEELMKFCEKRPDSKLNSVKKDGKDRTVSIAQLMAAKGLSGMIERGVSIIDKCDFEWMLTPVGIMSEKSNGEKSIDFDGVADSINLTEAEIPLYDVSEINEFLENNEILEENVFLENNEILENNVFLDDDMELETDPDEFMSKFIKYKKSAMMLYLSMVFTIILSSMALVYQFPLVENSFWIIIIGGTLISIYYAVIMNKNKSEEN
jgi:hypothetical protein